MLKKKVIIQKGFNILLENPIILFYHFNTISTKKWQSLKNEIKTIKKIDVLIIHNKIIKKTQTNEEQFSNAFLNNSQNEDQLQEKSVHFTLKHNKFVDDFINSNMIAATKYFGNCDSNFSIDPITYQAKRDTKSDMLLNEKTKSLNRLQEQLVSSSKKKNIQSVNSISKIKKETFVCFSNSLENEQRLKNGLPKAKEISSLIQGPTFIIGCKTRDQLISLNNLWKLFDEKLSPRFALQRSNFLFVGGFYNTQPISYLSLKKLITLDKSVNTGLISFLKCKNLLFFSIPKRLVSNLLSISR